MSKLIVAAAAFVNLRCVSEAMPAPKEIVKLRAVRSTFDEENPELLRPLPDVGLASFPTRPTEAALIINSSQKYQEILGFGGAFTEATALGWRSLSPADQEKVLHMFFADPSEGGHGFTMGRVPMGSTDFSPTSYNFDETPGDVDMLHFDHGATHDEHVGMLPMMRAARKLVQARGYELRIVASPWSPPGWMKLPKDGKRTMIGSARPNGLDPQYQLAYAKYFSAFVDTYDSRGIGIWAVTVQNEPENPAEWEGCLYTPEFMASFTRDYLGPLLRKEHPEVKIITYDHNKDHMVHWGEVMYADAAVRDYLYGMAVHWYGGLNTAHMDLVHKMAPKMIILPTEACNCDGVTYRQNAKKWWQRAEDIALDTMADLNHWANGYVVWNMVVNTTGGPNHADNVCDADVIADPHSTQGLGTIVTQATYYLGGHYSRFIPPGSHRIGLESTVTTQTPPVSATDVLYGYLLLKRCADDADSKAIQTWTYGTDPRYDDPEDLALKVLGLCADIVNSNTADGAVLYLMKCQYGRGEALRLRKVPGGSSSSFQIYNTEVYTNAGLQGVEKCFTSRMARGSDIGMDRGVQLLVVEMFDCLPAGALNQTFRLVRLSDGGECQAGDSCRIATGFPDGESEMCVQPKLVRVPHFDAGAFQAPNGDLSVVALNFGDENVQYSLYDAQSDLGARDLVLPPHSMVSYSWTSTSIVATGRAKEVGSIHELADTEESRTVSGVLVRPAWLTFTIGHAAIATTALATLGLLGAWAARRARRCPACGYEPLQ